uniref:Uncharacterized protein n=1 Tax=Brassica oleracea TaxID=3712 RepID=A0A3P6EWR9_BRAOL|nr:unnamed protein product [Brassica oleracea]
MQDSQIQMQEGMLWFGDMVEMTLRIISLQGQRGIILGSGSRKFPGISVFGSLRVYLDKLS